ncbi:hypothetical protein JQ633_19335 [Bradyrhizobium tropiciagri]|uniref:DUF6894 family protein n=1 Tax=Bradyrhizobium tropiciagri TaxID=312253 RepID=UPI001BAC65DF|nr:hypothetical protein [Bradyrhizobium tropiciagri]MBR0872523.1 hypothetical protein [Bradyrhizobium tropiciagri]
MTRYFFDIRDGTGLYPDEEGLDLPDQRAAEMEAAHTLAVLARDAASMHGRDDDVAVEVRTGTDPLFHAALVFHNGRARH